MVFKVAPQKHVFTELLYGHARNIQKVFSRVAKWSALPLHCYPCKKSQVETTSPEAKLQARYNPLFGRRSTQNHEFVDHFILADLSEIACKKQSKNTGWRPKTLAKEKSMGSNLYWFHTWKFVKFSTIWKNQQCACVLGLTCNCRVVYFLRKLRPSNGRDWSRITELVRSRVQKQLRPQQPSDLAAFPHIFTDISWTPGCSSATVET